jgi:hypothetical protein
MLGQVMAAAGVSAGLLDGSMNGSGGSYKRGLYAPGMVYGSGEYCSMSSFCFLLRNEGARGRIV